METTSTTNKKIGIIISDFENRTFQRIGLCIVEHLNGDYTQYDFLKRAEN